MEVAGYIFTDGPHDLNSTFSNASGIYLITDSHNQLIDCGQTNDLGNRMASHERKVSWYQCALGGQPLLYFLPEASEAQRLNIEKVIRLSYLFTCGVR